VVVRGAIDVEMDWNTYPDTREWYDGYDSLTNTPIYDFGDAAGCSQTTTNTTCNHGWTQNRVWWVSDGFLLAQSLPRRPTPTAAHTEGWTQLYNLLNADPTLRHRPRWSADIGYSS
jgi:hypothetical protein